MTEKKTGGAVDLLPVKNDYVFAQLFGARSHKRVLVCLLNSILDGKPHIKSITLDPTEYKRKSPDGKSMRLDIAATTDDGTRINIEMQCYHIENIEDRAAFYQYQLQEKELRSGDDYSNVPNVISIWIVTENVNKRNTCCNEMVLMYKDNGVDGVEIASEKLRHFVIELTKLEMTPKRFLNDMFTVWMRFIKDPASIPPEFLNIPEVKEAMDELTVMSMDPKTRDEYNYRLKELNDLQAIKTAADKIVKAAEEQKAKAEEKAAHAEEKAAHAEEKATHAEEKAAKAEAAIVLEKAKAEKRMQQEKIDMAKAMLSAGLDIEQVVQISGLSVEQLNDIR